MSTRGIQPGAAGRLRCSRIQSWTASSRLAPVCAGCTFFGPSATTGSAAVRSPVGKVASGLAVGGVIARWRGHVAGPRMPAVPSRPPDVGERSNSADCSQYAVTACAARLGTPGGAQGQWRVGRSSTRPVLKHGPRSLTCARVMGSSETQRHNESEGRLRLA